MKVVELSRSGSLLIARSRAPPPAPLSGVEPGSARTPQVGPGPGGVVRPSPAGLGPLRGHDPDAPCFTLPRPGAPQQLLAGRGARRSDPSGRAGLSSQAD